MDEQHDHQLDPRPRESCVRPEGDLKMDYDKIMSEGFEKRVGGVGLGSLFGGPKAAQSAARMLDGYIDQTTPEGRLKSLRTQEARQHMELVLVRAQIAALEEMVPKVEPAPAKTLGEQLGDLINAAPKHLRPVIEEAISQIFASKPDDTPHPLTGGDGTELPEGWKKFSEWGDDDMLLNWSEMQREIEVILKDGTRGVLKPGDAAMNWPSNPVVAYRITTAPASQIEARAQRAGEGTPTPFGRGWTRGWEGSDRPDDPMEFEGYEQGSADRAAAIAVGNPHVPNYDGTGPQAPVITAPPSRTEADVVKAIATEVCIACGCEINLAVDDDERDPDLALGEDGWKCGSCTRRFNRKADAASRPDGERFITGISAQPDKVAELSAGFTPWDSESLRDPPMPPETRVAVIYQDGFMRKNFTVAELDWWSASDPIMFYRVLGAEPSTIPPAPEDQRDTPTNPYSPLHELNPDQPDAEVVRDWLGVGAGVKQTENV
jgi:hypothetical protein